MHENFNCPDCYEPLNEDFSCKNGHHFEKRAGVLRLLKQSESQELSIFLEKFALFREKNGFRIKDENIYPQLPFIENGLAGTSWKARAFDVKYILSQLPKHESTRILEIGGWNGWLSYRLTEAGHQVTAIDTFLDKYDGLEAIQFYPLKWQCVQMNIDEIDKIIGSKYDVIILNWGAAYIVNLSLYVDKLKTLLRPNGKIIFIGIAIYPNSKQKAAELVTFNAAFKAEYGINLFFKPCKGYLTWEDKKTLEKKGFHLHLYPFWRSQFRALIGRKGAMAFYALYFFY